MRSLTALIYKQQPHNDTGTSFSEHALIHNYLSPGRLIFFYTIIACVPFRSDIRAGTITRVGRSSRHFAGQDELCSSGDYQDDST